MRIRGRVVRFDKLPKIVKSCSFAGNQANPRTKWMPKVVGRWDEPQMPSVCILKPISTFAKFAPRLS